jgi:hypothetical protein
MPDELRERLVEAAASSERSLNKEIVGRLEQSFEVAAAGQPARGEQKMSRARPVRSYRIAAVAAFAVVAALVAGLLTSGGHHSSAPSFKRVEPDSAYSLKGQAGIPNEGPDATYEAQQEALRAYPADSVPLKAQLDSQATFASVEAKGDGPGDWQLIGPTRRSTRRCSTSSSPAGRTTRPRAA